MHACVGRGYICTGREPVNKSVWGLGVWGWNMVPGMWSNVKNSATPGNNKSPDVASPQNKYTPPYKSSIWTMSRNKDAPNTSPTHPNTHTHIHTCSQHPSHTAALFIYTLIYLFVCRIKWKLLVGEKFINRFVFVNETWSPPPPSHRHLSLKCCLCINGWCKGGWGLVQGARIGRFN